MMAYIPMWFEIKGNPYVQMSGRHLYKTAKLMKEQSIEVQELALLSSETKWILSTTRILRCP